MFRPSRVARRRETIEVGISGIDPGVDALGCAVGQREVDIDDDAVVIQRNGDGYGFSCGGCLSEGCRG